MNIASSQTFVKKVFSSRDPGWRFGVPGSQPPAIGLRLEGVRIWGEEASWSTGELGSGGPSSLWDQEGAAGLIWIEINLSRYEFLPKSLTNVCVSATLKAGLVLIP